MKKIIISLVLIIFSISVVLIIAFSFSNKKTKLNVQTLDKQYVLELGEYEVENYEKSGVNGCNEFITFTVKNENDFYNKIIKKSEFYKADLEYEVDGYYSFGFFVEKNCIFEYTIKNRKVKIIELAGWYFGNTIDDVDVSSYSIIPSPINTPLYYNNLNPNTAESEFDYEYDTHLYDSNIGFGMLVDIYRYVDQDYYLIKDNQIHLKGKIIKKENYNMKIELSKDYLITLTLDGEDVKVGNYDM